MIYNATLLRIDPPPPGDAGAALSIRCAVTSPTAEQAAVSAAMEWSATLVLILPMRDLAAAGGTPPVNHRAVFQQDGCPSTTCRIAHVAGHVGRGLSHVELFLAAV